MNTRQAFSGAAFAVFSAFIVWGSLGAVAPAAECEISFEPDTVLVGQERTVVQATTSEEVGEIDGVQVDDDSGLTVTLSPDRALSLEVNSMEANAGDWAVNLQRAEESVCTGNLTVAELGLR